MIPTYQIWRLKQSEYDETDDVYIGFRRTEKEAKDWIDSQKGQALSPDQYYIKPIGVKGA